MEPPRGGGPVVTAPVAMSRGRPVIIGLVVLVALVAGGQPSFSVGANLLVGGVGGALFLMGMVRPANPRARRPPRAAGWWLVPLAGLVVAEVAGYAMGSTHDYPTLSRLADPWLEHYPVRAGAFLAWTAAFWALARR
jgi:hypothetical protein